MAGTRRLESQEDLDALARVFRKYPEVRAVYLFGSAAEGRTHRESDLDLAVVPRSPAARARRLDMLTDLAREGFCDVDLVFLDTNDIVLKYEAVRLNQVVYQTEEFDRGEMYSRIVRQYLDFLPYLQVQREAYKRRILHDSGRGHPQAAEQTG
ncbi:MAG: nucleotidyltransferase domain-containing protein [Chloroflexi bacterium]|nr:nucleotidyltransferase domain-containing protein [Chloroflexota bacterium]